jgi:mono/diheme cytochrome c family protein
MRAASLFLVAGLVLAGCGEEKKQPAPTSTSSSADSAGATRGVPPGDPAKGRQVWLGQCVACHNAEPAKDGPVGPAVKGSSPELLEARVVRGTYPPGYTPKRPTKVMPPRPDLAPSIPDLVAYLR